MADANNDMHSMNSLHSLDSSDRLEGSDSLTDPPNSPGRLGAMHAITAGPHSPKDSTKFPSSIVIPEVQVANYNADMVVLAIQARRARRGQTVQTGQSVQSEQTR